eukprot:jgi/Psemu1/42309/gm1.42309_g
MLAAHKCLVHTKINKACKSQRDLPCIRYLHIEATDGNNIAGILHYIKKDKACKRSNNNNNNNNSSTSFYGAALMLAVAQKNNGNLTAADAMKQVAFPADDCNNKSIQRRVLHQKNKMLALAIPSTVELNQDSTSISPLTLTPVDIIADWDIISALAAKQQQRDREDCTDKATTTTNTRSRADSAAVPASTSASRADSTNTCCAGSKRGSVAVARMTFINKKKPRRNATQLNYLQAAGEEQKERYLKGIAAGIKMYTSGEDIANYVSRLHGTSITLVGTIRYHVWKQNTHQHDLVEPSAGRPSKLPPMVEKALVTAMETYSNLMSAEMKEKPNCLGQIEQLECCLKDSPSTLKDCVALYKHLSAKYAVEVGISTKHLQPEERHCVWTTSNNIDTWFETVKEILVVYGFAHLATEEETRNGHEGEFVFFPGQLNRILNVDKTTLTLDRTSTNAGSRPVMEYGPSNRILPWRCTWAQKSSWRCTAVARSTAAGDPIPFHFQLKSNAMEENKRLSKSFTDELDKSGTCSGVWSIPGATMESPTQMPHTVNCNQAAGMDSVEFRKYFETSIMPLFPDAQPAKGKYACFIVDSGPGRSDPELHWLMSTKGFLSIAGVPNTTHVTQVTDVSFNPFKTAFILTRRNSTHTGDLKADLNRVCWAKIGIALFTRKCLGDRNVAHELMMLANGMIDVQTLVDHRFNGVVYTKKAPRISLNSTLPKTQPNTRAYQDELQQSTAAEPRYTDQHIVYERIRREGNINAMKETKTKALAYTKNKEAAEPIMEQCNGDFMDLPILQLRKVFEWKLQEKSTKLNKDDMVVGALEWTEVDEAEFKRLIEEDIQIKHTELGKAMAKDLIQLVSMATTTIIEERMEIAHKYLSATDCEKLQVMSNTWHCQS